MRHQTPEVNKPDHKIQKIGRGSVDGRLFKFGPHSLNKRGIRIQALFLPGAVNTVPHSCMASVASWLGTLGSIRRMKSIDHDPLVGTARL